MPAIPGTMKAVLLKGHGGFDQLEFREDVPVPRPEEGAVLVQIGAAGVNNTDINTRTAWYSRAVSEGTTAAGAAGGFEGASAEDSGWTGMRHRFPRIQGADGCGRKRDLDLALEGRVRRLLADAVQLLRRRRLL